MKNIDQYDYIEYTPSNFNDLIYFIKEMGMSNNIYHRLFHKFITHYILNMDHEYIYSHILFKDINYNYIYVRDKIINEFWTFLWCNL